MRNTAASACIAVSLLSAGGAQAFEVQFDWGDIPLCTSGYPDLVPSPRFALKDVPKGAASLTFHLRDLNVTYDHGGGSVAYGGGDAVAAGAFTYKSPCPPNGPHTYEWTITARDAAGRELAVATARRSYP